MKASIKKFLQFNGKNIYFKSNEGKWWIAIKPICEALNIAYSRQLRTLKSDKKMGQLWSLETIVAADGRLRKMVCLEEEIVYVWIFKLKSNSPELEEYQLECYHILFTYFRGAITGRTDQLKEKTKLELEEEALRKELFETETGQRLAAVQKAIKKANSSLRRLDEEYVSQQIELWTSGV